MPIRTFNPDELECLRMLLADPPVFDLTELEIRACSLVLMQSEGDERAQEDHLAIACNLLEATAAS